MAEQTIKLGILGAETTLTGVGRIFASSGNDENEISGRSANGTLHTDFISRKRTYTLTFGVLTEATKDVITAIYDLQLSVGSFLNFIYTDESGVEIATVVKMGVPSFGAISPKDVFYYGGTSISLEEV